MSLLAENIQTVAGLISPGKGRINISAGIKIFSLIRPPMIRINGELTALNSELCDDMLLNALAVELMRPDETEYFNSGDWICWRIE